MRYDDIIQLLPGLCALRHYSVTAGAVCVTTFFNPSRGCVLYDDITLSLQGLCALQRHSSAIVSCYEGTCQPSLVPVTVPVPAMQTSCNRCSECAQRKQSSGIAGCAMGYFSIITVTVRYEYIPPSLQMYVCYKDILRVIRRGVFLR